MKLIRKIYYIVTVLFAVTALSSCYDDYTVDTIGYTSVYFPYNTLERSAIAGEGMTFSMAVKLGGVSVNEYNHTVIYKIDESLLADTDYKLLPEDYYELSNDNTFTISAGSFEAYIDITFDEDKCYNDPDFLDYNYALPLRIVTTSADIILEDFNYCIYPVKMINTYEGYYYQVGTEQQILMKPVPTYSDKYSYGDFGDYTDTPVRSLETKSENSVRFPSIGYTEGDDAYLIDLIINEDNSVSCELVDGSSVTAIEDFMGTWDPETRIFELSYTYYLNNSDQTKYEVEETLVFRNRVRDGLSEWRWEGFDGN